MQVPHGGHFHAGRPLATPPHQALLQGLPGPLPSWPGSLGGECHCPLRSWSPWHFKVFTSSRFRGSCEVFWDVTFLPANFLALLDIEDPQAGWVPTRPESHQLLHFASNGQLCKGTKPQPPFQWLPNCFLETHTKDQL